VAPFGPEDSPLKSERNVQNSLASMICYDSFAKWVTEEKNASEVSLDHMEKYFDCRVFSVTRLFAIQSCMYFLLS